ncbi:MAG: hypothetical protein NDJ89_02920 [Oligoflexia bacterium]|nr:hypothetical protein [Oligoflexia bacterium]
MQRESIRFSWSSEALASALPLVLPIGSVAAVAGLSELSSHLNHPPVFRALLYFFRETWLRPIYPFLFLFSYLHLARNAALRERLFLAASVLILLLSLLDRSPLLSLGIACYSGFSLLLILLVKRLRALTGPVIALACIAFVVGLRGLMEIYQPFFEGRLHWPPGTLWQYLVVALLGKRIVELIPVFLSDLPKMRCLSTVSLASYLWNPILMLHHLPVFPSEYADWGRDGDSRTVLKGWRLIGIAVLLKAISFPLWRNGPVPLPSMAFLEIGFQILSWASLASGLLMIFGRPIKAPFHDILKSRTPADVLNSWNVYWNEWLMKFAFYPALRIVPNFYVAFLWVFFVSGLRHNLMLWFFGKHEVTVLAAVLWVFGPWLALVIFLQRRLRSAVQRKRWAQAAPAWSVRSVQVAVILLVIAVPAYVQRRWFPELPW